MSTSIAPPFSAWIMTRPPCSRVCSRAPTIAPSSAISLPGYAMNILNEVTPSSSASARMSAAVRGSNARTTMWKP